MADTILDRLASLADPDIPVTPTRAQEIAAIKDLMDGYMKNLTDAVANNEQTPQVRAYNNIVEGLRQYQEQAQTTMGVLEEEIRMRSVTSRLEAREVTEHRAKLDLLKAWAESLSYDELGALIEECRRKYPDDMALLEAMSVAELDVEIKRRVKEGVL